MGSFVFLHLRAMTCYQDQNHRLGPDQKMQFRFHDHTIRVNQPDRQSLLAAVKDRFRAGIGFTLATINLDHLVKLRRSAELGRIYAAHDFVVADGNPIVWLSRLAGRPVSLVPGSDLLVPLLQLAAKEGVPVAFFGSRSEVLTRAASVLSQEIPGLSVVWTASPPMGFDPQGHEAKQALSDMRAAGARLCIVSLSSPLQDKFSNLGRTLAPEIGFCCLGASLDFVAGYQTRAPKWVQALAMEWLWRALSAPRRLIPRYAACAAILPSEALKALRQRAD